MPKLTIHDRKGNKVGTYNVEAEDFASSINKQLLHDAVVMYQANLRQGTHKTKTRAQVAGNKKKMYRQKGTGNARAGSKRSGVRRGGGHIHARQPRDYSYRLPRKALQIATRMALASKVRDDELIVIDELRFDAPRTKDMAHILKVLGCDQCSTLVTTETHDLNVYRSVRNLASAKISPASELNALSLLASKKVLVTKAALDALRAKPGGKSAAKPEAAAAS
ncbi:50S ribosomal protein L4 [Pirellulimonas nuda]|uniref:Large ribosomal subunit protein uL4 n=1 Tax=Pirellulimonas nuda TaxID=2528009 RepID=A0A518DIK9_9BACT|nr:50S ribosomal protein L4 [Pirellulimonas nuda]QDU91308.1 50S ribosomal protein L4 [Pirellulimonas nuda]